MTRPFVIAGCGRSGTMGMARLLNAAGVRTAFEEFFAPHRDPPERGFAAWCARTNTAGEVSGLAAPFLAGRESDLTVLHQVRNPVGVIASLLGQGTWTEKAAWPNVKFNYRWLPELDPDADPLTQSMTYWLGWNELVEDAGPLLRFRARDVTAESLADLLGRLGLARTADGLRPAVARVWTGAVNAGPRQPVCWRLVPETDLKGRLRAKAREYGYSEDELGRFCPAVSGEGCPCGHKGGGEA